MQATPEPGLLSVPVAPVPFHLAERGRDLIGMRLDLLEADDVGAVPLDPFPKLRLARADAVDVPGGDLHPEDIRARISDRAISRA
jgi:hypothetical protein